MLELKKETHGLPLRNDLNYSSLNKNGYIVKTTLNSSGISHKVNARDNTSTAVASTAAGSIANAVTPFSLEPNINPDFGLHRVKRP